MSTTKVIKEKDVTNITERLTEEQIRERASMAALSMAEAETFEEEVKEQCSSLRAELKAKKAKVGRLLRAVREGRETFEHVTVDLEFNLEDDTVLVKYTDDYGKPRQFVRPMSGSEMEKMQMFRKGPVRQEPPTDGAPLALPEGQAVDTVDAEFTKDEDDNRAMGSTDEDIRDVMREEKSGKRKKDHLS